MLPALKAPRVIRGSQELLARKALLVPLALARRSQSSGRETSLVTAPALVLLRGAFLLPMRTELYARTSPERRGQERATFHVAALVASAVGIAVQELA